MNSKYGRKSGWLRYLRFAFEHRLGRYKEFETVDWDRVDRLIFVCKGNICRSPYAEARAKMMGFNAISAGLNARPRDLANASAQKVADELGVDITKHRATHMNDLSIGNADLLIGFEPWHAAELASYAKSNGAQVTLIGLHSSPVRAHLEDPFALTESYFKTCYKIIDSGLESMSNEIGWRKNYPVLVAHAETLGALAVIRSLGRAGFPVHAVSHQEDALGFASRYTVKPTEAPDYSSPKFFDWLNDYIKEYNIKAIVPSEAMLLALESRYEEYAKYLPFSQRKEVVYAGLSKFDLFTKLKGAQNLPPFVSIDFEKQEVIDPTSLSKLGLPLFIKTDTLYSRNGKKGGVAVASSVDEAMVLLAQLQEDFKKILVQGFVPGRGLGACFILWKNKVLAQFLHLRLHEVPYTGGVSSYRRSVTHEEIRKDALDKLQRMNWEGPVMVEYRWDESTGKFYLMEMNGRFWGSLHLALHANVDMPKILLDAFFGRPGPAVLAYPDNIRCRYTYPADVQHTWSLLKDPKVELKRKIYKVAKFLALGLNPRVESDLAFPGDRKIYWIAVKRFFARTSLISAVLKRIGRERRAIAR